MEFLLKNFIKTAELSAKKREELAARLHAQNKVKQIVTKELRKKNVNFKVAEATIEVCTEDYSVFYEGYEYNLDTPKVYFNGVCVYCLEENIFIRVENIRDNKVELLPVIFDLSFESNRLEPKFIRNILKDIESFKSDAIKSYKNYKHYIALRNQNKELLNKWEDK